jgi:Core-2/I-Branching enzyme
MTPIPVLYCCLFHNSPLSILRLFKYLYNYDDIFIIHLDTKADQYTRSVVSAFAELPNVHLLSKHDCAWGGQSLVEASLDILSVGLSIDANWSHAIFLSAAHLPTRPPKNIRSWLKAGHSVMRWHAFQHTPVRPDGWEGGIWDRFHWRYLEEPGTGMRRLGKAPDFEWTYATGGQWVILAKNHVEYIVKEAPAELRRRMSITFIPDEAYFQTLLCNSRFANEVVWTDATYVLWKQGAHPEDLSLQDYVRIARTRLELFARKFPDYVGQDDEADRTIRNFVGPTAIDALICSIESELMLRKVSLSYREGNVMGHVIDNTRADLGGNWRHGDIHTWCPELWKYLVDRFAIKSVLDVGCGEGHAVRFFHKLGLIAHGIDGLELNVKRAVFPVACHDILANSYLMPVDFVWSCEVAEHISEEKVDNYIDTLCNGAVIAMTHALPGQGGHHHVNCQPKEYWVDKITRRGYALSEDLDIFLSISRTERTWNYFSQSGLVFIRS